MVRRSPVSQIQFRIKSIKALSCKGFWWEIQFGWLCRCTYLSLINLLAVRVRRWGNRLCLGFDKNIESLVIYRFKVMQGVVNLRSTHLGRSPKTRFSGWNVSMLCGVWVWRWLFYCFWCRSVLYVSGASIWWLNPALGIASVANSPHSLGKLIEWKLVNRYHFLWRRLRFLSPQVGETNWMETHDNHLCSVTLAVVIATHGETNWMEKPG